MKPYEYRKALEVLIEHSMLARERGAYKTALDMFMMVDYPVEREDITRWGSGGIVINEEVVKAVEKMSRETKENVTLTVGELDSAEAIAMQEAEGSAEDQDEEPEGQPEEDPDNCRIPDPAAGESKADPVIGKTLEQAAGEGKADPVIDNAPEQAAEEGKADPVIDNAPKQAAGEGKADPVIGNAPAPAAGEGKADPVIDNVLARRKRSYKAIGKLF